MKINLEDREGTRWRGSPALAITLALISISIFAWGLRYKLSLYKDSQQRTATLGVAKLLSPKNASVAVSRPQDGTSPGTSLTWAVLPHLSTAVLPWLIWILISNSPVGMVRSSERWRAVHLYSKPPPSSC